MKQRRFVGSLRCLPVVILMYVKKPRTVRLGAISSVG